MWSFLAVFCSSRWMELRTDFNISQLNSEFQYISFGRGTTDIKSIILITIDLVLGKMLRTRRNENATKRSSVVAQCTNALLLIFRDIFFPRRSCRAGESKLVCISSRTLSLGLRTTMTAYLYSTEGMSVILFLLKTLIRQI